MAVRTLVVDDQPVIRGNLRLRFERIGCRVEEAGSALEGLEIFRKFHPQVVTLDIVMPNVGNFTALDLLRQIRKESPETDVIVISSKTDEREEFLKQGAMEFISKPFESFERLLAKLKPLIEVLDQSTQ
jgi:CheY-like chemotaxis protein